MPEVNQSDREAAASLYLEQMGPPNSPHDYGVADDIKAGHNDEWSCVQAFARHRTTSLAAQDGLVEKVARIISPDRWAVMDNYLKMAKRQYAKSNAAYDPEAFKDDASMKLALEILSAIKGDKS